MDETNVKHQVEPGIEPGEEPSVESCSEPCGSTISFHNICYKVETKSGCCRSSPKTVLKDVSGICKPGMMNAILGPTGSGKSSLLDVLAGRKDPAGLSGHVLVDGKEQPKNFKCMTGYVVQEDVVMGTLTVTENLMFSANLRLPKTVPTSEKIKRVKDVIFELGLGHCADSKVGTQLIRGISGGERKRTNIGMELIISPSVLFLDEPTTGLDASTAKAVLLLLHRLSRKGRPIIFSIHQPRYSIFKLFDNLTLLAGGMAVYQGPAHQALDYFQSIGYECEAHNNPPDFFLDVINGDSTAVQDSDRIEASDPVVKLSSNDEEYGGTYSGFKVMTSGSYSKLGAGELDVEIGNVREDLTTKLADIFNNSTCMKELHAEIDPIEREYKAMLASGSSDVRIVANYNTSFLTQMWYLSKRTLLNNLRNPQTSIFQVIITIIFALLTGTIYLQLDNSLAFGIQNRVGVFFFIIMNQVFSNLSSVDIFIKERVIFVHENASGFYRVSAYFLSKIFCDILPLRLVPTIIFCAITYFMIGLRADVIKYLMFNLNVLLTTIAGSAVVLFGSSSTPIFAVANMICVLFFIVMLIFGGLLINLDSLGPWLQWLKYISVMRYGINFLSINEMAGLEFCAEVVTNGTLTEVCDPNAGNAYLEVQGIAYKTNWDLWQNELALVIFTIVVLFLGYVQMRRIQILK